MRSAFTLIELLVVIAIIAVLSVVVVLSLNPAELLRQSRDANRLSDLSTLNSALALYTTDQAGIAGFSLGNASSVYVSLPDTSSTCGTWNLPTLPSGYTYACSTSTSSKNINNTGWIPVNFSNISGGAPFSNLPIDNVNQSSTELYYTYYSNGSQFMVTAIPESQKQKTALGEKPMVSNFPEVIANGSSLGISPLFSMSGLVGYWNFDEGSGSSALDQSGNNNTGTWSGTPTGNNSTFYNSGKIGDYSGQFDGSMDVVTIPNAPSLNLGASDFSASSWVKFSRATTPNEEIVGNANPANYVAVGWSLFKETDGSIKLRINTGSAYLGVGSYPTVISAGTWVHLVGVRSGSTGYVYINGMNVASATGLAFNVSNTSSTTIGGRNQFGGNSPFQGQIDDVRIYNRALSPAEIQALYNAGK